MKKIRNVENPFEFETVVFSFSEEQILRELIAESSYVAKSLVGQSDLKLGWSRSIIFSEDDKPFLSRWLADAPGRSYAGLCLPIYPMSLFPPKQHLFLPFFCLGNARWRSMNQFVISLNGRWYIMF